MAQDAFFRNVKIDNMTVSSLKAQLLSSVKSDNTQTAKNNKPVDDLNKTLNKILDKKLDVEVKRLTDAMKKLTKLYEDAKKNGGSVGGGTGGAAKGKKDLCACICECLTKGMADIQKAQTTASKSAAASSDRTSGASKLASGLSRSGILDLPAKLSAVLYDDKPVEMLAKTLSSGIGKGITGALTIAGGPLGGAAGGFIESIINSITKPLMDQLDVLKNVYQINFAQGIKSSTSAMEKFNVSEEDAADAGQRQSVIQAQLFKNAKRGITDAKTLKTLTKGSLAFATQLGSSAAETADLFTDWTLHLGASTSQLSIMQRGMAGVARETGITGDNLIKVAKSSETFLKNMRLSGTFTAQAANNIISFLARAEKTGTSEGAQRVLGVLQGSTLHAGDEKAKNLLTMLAGNNGGLQNRLITGTANSKEDFKFFGDRIIAELSKIALMQTGKSDLSKLTPQEWGKVTLVAEGVLGFKGKELEIMGKNLQEAGKSFEDKLKDLTTSIGKTSIASEKQRMNQEKDVLIFNESAEVIEKFKESIAGGKGINEALKGAGGGALLGAIGSKGQGAGAIGDILSKQKEILDKQAQDLKVGDKFKDVQFSQVDIDNAVKGLAEGNNKAFLDIVERSNLLQSKLNAENLRKNSPYKELEDSLFKMEAAVNNLIKQIAQELLPKLIPAITELTKAIIELTEYMPGRQAARNANLAGKQATVEDSNSKKMADVLKNDPAAKAATLDRLKKEKADLESELLGYKKQYAEFQGGVAGWLIAGASKVFGGSVSNLETNMSENLQAIERKNIAIANLENAPQKAEGTNYVKRSGVAYIHKGESIVPSMQDTGPYAAPMMPYNALQQFARSQYTNNNTGKDLTNIESNTDETAKNSGRMVQAIVALGKLLSRAANRQSGNLDSTTNVEVLFDDILNTEWPNARYGRTVGVEFDINDFS